jgi:hypothetical protein
MKNKLLHQPMYTFLLCLMLCSILYLPSYKGVFGADFTTFIEVHGKLSFWQYLMLTPSSLYQGVNLVHYIAIALFGLNPIPWFLFFMSLHALNGVQLFYLFRRYLNMLGWESKTSLTIASGGAALWLLGPLAVEVAVWKACSHYLVSLALFFLILSFLLRYIESGKIKYIYSLLITYVISTVFLEYFYITPIYVLFFTAALVYARAYPAQLIFLIIKKAILPMALIFVAYYAVFYAVSGNMLARIGEGEVPRSWTGYFYKLMKYVVHIFALEYFYPEKLKHAIYRIIENTYTLTIFIAGLLLLSFAAVRGYWTWSLRAKSLFVFLVLSLASCTLTLPMWFYDMFSYQGSRYFYFPSVFFYMLFSIFLLSLSRRFRLSAALFCVFLLVNVVATFKLSINAGYAGHIFNKILYDYKWEKEPQVFLLSLPIFFRGVPVIDALREQHFAEHLRAFRKDTISGEIYDVSAFNMNGRWDGANVTVFDSLTFKVSLNQYGSWWWFESVGGKDYETDLYKVTYLENGFSYLLQFKEMPHPNAKFLYLIGSQWKEVDRSKLHEAQW